MFASCLSIIQETNWPSLGYIYAGEICYRITDLSFSSLPRPFKCFLSKCSGMGYTLTDESIDLDQASDLLIDLLGILKELFKAATASDPDSLSTQGSQ